MKILIAQAKRTNDIELLKRHLKNSECDLVVFPEGYISNEGLLEECCQLAKVYNKPILSSYLSDEARKDNAVIINESGKVVLKRKKSLVDGPLLEPSKSIVNNISIGYMLCCEVFLKNIDFSEVDIIFNPIGTGMFNEEQFEEWSERARTLAIKNNCFVVGTSHADGSYRNCGISIPIAYVYDKRGEEIYLSKNDTRTVIIDLETKEIKFINE